LLISLLLHAFTLPQEQEVWDEFLVPWLRGQRIHRLQRRGRVVLCRLGLITALLVWSGWPQRQSLSWGLLSLPLADAMLSLLPLYWPGVLKVRAYPHLVCGAHHLYCLTLAALFSTGLSRQGPISVVLVMGGCVKVADGTWRLKWKGISS